MATYWECIHNMMMVRNPLTYDLNIQNLYICTLCGYSHVCDEESSDCKILDTPEGMVCLYTGLTHIDRLSCIIHIPAIEADRDTLDIDYMNAVQTIIRRVFIFFKTYEDKYKHVTDKIFVDNEFNPQVLTAVIRTFKSVFTTQKLIDKVSILTISKLFIQLLIGKYAQKTTYDSRVIKVSKRKREDTILKQMRYEYGNAHA
ncbi:protein U63 [Proboscivirus elephantidbeta4]|uniref:Protein U63 n=1 Tax=Elephant endotheliotropic herpesvirus 4 TaxID=548914 RepID=A0A0S1TQY9_9BETA|nr:protein U63 [Elephant endotheliotropic herpesvirus 4]ALM26012.1 protein U63 [Elephant endotheliotropic herpesvirus 4]